MEEMKVERVVAEVPLDDAPVEIPDDESMEMPMVDAPAAGDKKLSGSGDKNGDTVAAAQVDDGRSKAASSVVGLNIFKKKSKSKRKKK